MEALEAVAIPPVDSPADYADSTPPPFPPGTHDFRLLRWKLLANREGEMIKSWKGDFAVVLDESESLDGKGRVFGQTVWSSTYTRKRADGSDSTVSALADCVRSFDATASTNEMSLEDLGQFFDRHIADATDFRVRVIWEAFDEEYYREQGGPEASREEQKVLRKAATVRGKKAFENGPTVVGPSGLPITARAVFANFITKRA